MLSYLGIMKPIFSLLLTLMLGTAFGQTSIEFPYNPDSNGDGEIGVDDLLGMLSGFAEPWTLPDPNLWATETITNLLDYESDLVALSDSLEQMQLELDSIQSSIIANTNQSVLTHLAGFELHNPHYGNIVARYTSESCSFAMLRAYDYNEYGGTLRLSSEGREVGDLITVLYTCSNGNAGTWNIQSPSEIGWIQIASCTAINGGDGWSGGNYRYFRTFMWDGTMWISVE